MVIPDAGVGYLRVTHPCATLLGPPKKTVRVRLACVKHAASVRSEPGSNSPVCILARQVSPARLLYKYKTTFVGPFTCYLVFKDRTRRPMTPGANQHPIGIHAFYCIPLTLVKSFFAFSRRTLNSR